MARQKQRIKGAIAGLIVLLLGFVIVNHFIDPLVLEPPFENSDPLAWSHPDQLVDGSPMTDLSGYTIFCWNSANQQTLEIEVDDPLESSFEVKNFAPGTYQCAVKASSATSGDSALSNVVTRTIP